MIHARGALVVYASARRADMALLRLRHAMPSKIGSLRYVLRERLREQVACRAGMVAGGVCAPRGERFGSASRRRVCMPKKVSGRWRHWRVLRVLERSVSAMAMRARRVRTGFAAM